MAIDLEFIDLIVPIEVIRRKYPGGWEQCLSDHAGDIGRRVWFDDHLFRDGAMNPADAERLVDQWADRGFEITESRDGSTVWKDVCVVEVIFGGATRPCDWLEINTRERTGHLKGTKPGAAVGRSALAR